MDERFEYGKWDVPESPKPIRSWQQDSDDDGDIGKLQNSLYSRQSADFDGIEEGDLGQIGGYHTFDSPVLSKTSEPTFFDEEDLGELAHELYEPVTRYSSTVVDSLSLERPVPAKTIDIDDEPSHSTQNIEVHAYHSETTTVFSKKSSPLMNQAEVSDVEDAEDVEEDYENENQYVQLNQADSDSVEDVTSASTSRASSVAPGYASGTQLGYDKGLRDQNSERYSDPSDALKDLSVSGESQSNGNLEISKGLENDSTKSVDIEKNELNETHSPVDGVNRDQLTISSTSIDTDEPQLSPLKSSSHPSTEDADKSHKRNPSHFEYFQGATGDIKKVKVGDESSDSEEEWQPMATVGSYEVYDDKNNVVVELDKEDEHEQNAAASGYTRVADDDAVSVTSLDNQTDFLFDSHAPTDDVDAAFQLNSTKQMLSEEQRIAYAGLCRLSLGEMADHVHILGKRAVPALDSLRKWGSKMILRLYTHLDLNNEEQLMIETLAEHHVVADDLTPCLKVVQHSLGEVFEAVDASSANVNELHQESTKITTQLDIDVKWTVMCDLFLVLLQEASYDARSRCLLMLVAKKLGIDELDVCKFERKVTDVLQLDENADQDWTETDIIERRRKKNLRKKYAYVGLATLGGGLVIGLSGGLLAPVVGAGMAGALSTIGITGTAGFLAGAGGTAIITTASTAIGARVGGKAMSKRTGHVKTFDFRPIFNNNRVNVIITVSGWLTGKDDDVRLPFSTIDPVMGDVLTVSWEPEMMRSLGQTINILATEALTMGVQQVLAATIMATLMGALQAPMWLSKLSYLVDNPWSVSLDRAWAAGLILADTIMKRNLGSRPVTLVGYSLGARAIYSCLAELSKRKAYGLVQDVLLFGTPVFYNKKQFTGALSVVAGRFVNGYSRKDWILAFLFPAAKRYGSVMGLDPIPSVENVDVSEFVDGHMSYRNKMPVLLAICGWAITSEEFDEIEDPDPDKLREKQRKLLEELDTDAKPKKRMFWNLDWLQRAKDKEKDKPEPDKPDELFDLDAIREEMTSIQPELIFDDQEYKTDDKKPGEKKDNVELSVDDVSGKTSSAFVDSPRQETETFNEPLASNPLSLPEFEEPEEPMNALNYDDNEWKIRNLIK